MSGTATLAWGLAALLGVAAAVLFARVRSMNVELGEAVVSGEKLGGELKAARQQLEREAAKGRRKSDELADLRKRHDKLKKRKGGDGGGASQPQAAAVTAGAAGERALEEARQERDRAREESTRLAAELTEARAAVEAAKPAPGSVDAAEAARLREAASQAEGKLAELRERAEKAEARVTRLEKKLESQETAYVQLRGELAAKKDRLTTLTEQLERLQALKVALVDADDAKPEDEAREAAPAEEAAKGEAAG